MNNEMPLSPPHSVAPREALTRIIVKGAAISALGGLLFGFDTVVISGTTQALTHEYRLSAFALGMTVSIALWGTVVGALLAGALGQKMDRRDGLRLVAILYLLSSVGCFFAWNWSSLIVFRFLAGLGIGGSSVWAPVYLAEISPAAWRGRLGSCFQVNVGLGVLFAYVTVYVLDALALPRTYLWRTELGLAAIPAALFFFLLGTIPSSARWLIFQGRVQEAEDVLRSMGYSDPEAEITSIVQAGAGVAASERLFSRKHLRPILLAVGLAIFNQLSGINAILYYLNDIFVASGFSRMSGNLHAVIVGATNLLFSLGAMALIDTVGRRFLLMVGALGTAGCLAGMALGLSGQGHTWLLFLSVVAFNFFFSISQGAILWVYLSEIFPTGVRVRGQSLGSSVHWVMNAVIAAVFPLLVKISPIIPFSFFAAMMLLEFLLVLFVYPETKGVSLEQLEQQLVRGKASQN